MILKLRDGLKSPLLGRGLGRGGDYKSFEQKITPSLEFVSSHSCLGFAPRSQSSAFGTSCLSAPSVRYPDSLRFVRPQIRFANKFFSLPRRDRHVAFTLAEVLITLGVIGVIAAMTMPTLMKKYQQHVTVNKLKKVYTEINNAVSLSKANNGDMAEWEILNSSSDRFDKYILPYLKISKIKYPVYIKVKGIGGKNVAVNHLGINTMAQKSYLISNIGVELFVNTIVGIPEEFRFAIFVDLNTINNGPNQFGKDVFIIYVLQNKVVFMQENGNNMYDETLGRNQLLNGPSSSNYQCNKSGIGYWCGALIMKDGWKIEKDYPW